MKDSEDSEQTSDRGSSMGSSVTGEDNTKDLKSPPEEVKELTAAVETTEEAVVEVPKKVKGRVKCREMATQVEPMKGKGKKKTGKSSANSLLWK